MIGIVTTLCLVAAEPKVDATALLKTFRDEFVLVEPGTEKCKSPFLLGQGAYEAPDAVAASVTIRLTKPFRIARYEVPQNLWEAVMGANPSRWKGPRNSVEMLSLDDAQEFCRKATEQMRVAGLIEAGQVVRLPSEAEWEFCARAGTTTRYSFGNDTALLGNYAWFTGNAAGNDPPVGAKLPNAWGLYDVHGYLWEWCGDVWTDDVGKLPTDGRRHAEGDAKFGVLRGGSWKDPAEKLTSGYRRRAERTLRDDAVGLRCVLAEAEK